MLIGCSEMHHGRVHDFLFRFQSEELKKVYEKTGKSAQKNHRRNENEFNLLSCSLYDTYVQQTHICKCGGGYLNIYAFQSDFMSL